MTPILIAYMVGIMVLWTRMYQVQKTVQVYTPEQYRLVTLSCFFWPVTFSLAILVFFIKDKVE